MKRDDARWIAALLRHAQSGKANFIQDRLLTEAGSMGLWEMELIGERPVPTYVAHGNFTVDREGVFRSRLTGKGERLLAEATAVLAP